MQQQSQPSNKLENSVLNQTDVKSSEKQGDYTLSNSWLGNNQNQISPNSANYTTTGTATYQPTNYSSFSNSNYGGNISNSFTPNNYNYSNITTNNGFGMNTNYSNLNSNNSILEKNTDKNSSFSNQQSINYNSFSKTFVSQNSENSNRSNLNNYNYNPTKLIKSVSFTEDNTSHPIRVRHNHNYKNSFNFDDTENDYCKLHEEICECIVLESNEKYKLYETICSECKAQADYDFNKSGKSLIAKQFSQIILENKEKIQDIKNKSVDNLKLDVSLSQDSNEQLNKHIFGLYEELSELYDDFYNNIGIKLGIHIVDNSQLTKIKEFINRMEVHDDNTPKVEKIGKNLTLKHQYIKLALFLLQSTGPIISNNNYSGITGLLKQHITKFIEFRKKMVHNITHWLRYLTGDFFQSIYRLEGGSIIDENFRKNLQIEFNCSVDLEKIKYDYEVIILDVRDRAKKLEEENSKLRREVENYRNNLLMFSDKEQVVHELKKKLKLVEDEWDNERKNCSRISEENQRISKLNSDYSIQIDQFRRESSLIKSEFEIRFKNAIENLQIEYEKQIFNLQQNLNDMRVNYNKLEAQFMAEKSSWEYEREGYNGKLKVLIERHETEVKNIRFQIENYIKELNENKLQINKLIAENLRIENDRDSYKNQLDNYRAQMNLLENNLKQLTDQYNSLAKEREKYADECLRSRSEIEKYRMDINTLKNLIEGLERKNKENENKLNEIGVMYVKLQQEVNMKITLISNLEGVVHEKNGKISLQENELEIFRKKIQHLDSIIKELNFTIEDLRLKNLIISEKDEEIHRLKHTISSCKEEWMKLSESYENLLADIKNQIQINEVLRNLVFELNSKIEQHNQQVGGIDAQIKQQIEVLTRQALAKKNIECNTNNKEIIRRADGARDNLSNKLSRIESQKLYKSAVFTNNNFDIDDFGKDSRKKNFQNNNLLVSKNNDKMEGKYDKFSYSEAEDFVLNKTNTNFISSDIKTNFNFGKKVTYSIEEMKKSTSFSFDKNVNNSNFVEKIAELTRLCPLETIQYSHLQKNPHLLDEAIEKAKAQKASEKLPKVSDESEILQNYFDKNENRYGRSSLPSNNTSLLESSFLKK